MLSSWKYCFPSFRTGTHRRRNNSGSSCHQWRLAYAADLNHPSLLEHTPVQSHPLVPSSLAEVRLLQTGTHSCHIPTVMQVTFDWTEAEAARLPCGARLICGWPCLSLATSVQTSHSCVECPRVRPLQRLTPVGVSDLQ